MIYILYIVIRRSTKYMIVVNKDNTVFFVIPNVVKNTNGTVLDTYKLISIQVNDLSLVSVMDTPVKVVPPF